jgi:plastocyanin
MKSKLIIVVALLVGISLGVGGVRLLNTSTTADKLCSKPVASAESHSVMIMDGKVEPGTTTAKLCDTLTFTNMDNIAREIAFGPHENHVPYDGVAEKVLNKDQSFTITLNQTGSFHFHDHLHDEVQGYFTVTK